MPLQGAATPVLQLADGSFVGQIVGGGTTMVAFDSSGTKYHLSGHLSPHITTDANGAVIGTQAHYPFGEKWYETGTTTKYKFTSYERDPETGNDYAMARYSVNRLGRFASVDPLAGDTANPQSLDRYAYVLNDPIDGTDPSGSLPSYCRGAKSITGVCLGGDSGGGDFGGCSLDGVDTPCNIAIGPGSVACPNNDCSAFNQPQTDSHGQQWWLIPGIDGLSWSNFANGDESNGDAELGLPSLPDGYGESLSGGGTSKPWEPRSTVVALLRAKNDCSEWFNKGTGSAADIMSNVPILSYTPKPEWVSFDMPDANTTSDPQQPIYVNTLGRFYTDRYNFNSVGGYAAGSDGAQITILLHELAHKVQPPGFMPIDGVGAPEGTSEKNTHVVIKHCADAINARKP